MASKVPLLKFNNGKTIPQLGLGTWNVSKFFFICRTYFMFRKTENVPELFDNIEQTNEAGWQKFFFFFFFEGLQKY